MAAVASTQQRPHVFFLPYTVQGHIMPLMRIANHLARSGCLVSFLNSEQNHLRIINSKQQQAPAEEGASPDHPNIRLLYLPDPPPSSHDSSPASEDVVQTHIRITEAFLDTDRAALKHLITSLDPPVTCFVVDIAATFLITPGLAQELGIPRFVFFIASAASFCMASLACKVGGDAHEMTNIPGAPPLRVSDVNTFLSASNGPKDIVSNFFKLPFTEGLLANDPILMNSFELLEPVTFEYLRKEYQIYGIGPIIPPSFNTDSLDIKDGAATLWAEDYSCLKWLDGHPNDSVLFVSFGSLALISSEQLVELAMGLEASHQRILWVTRPDLIYGKAPDLPKDFLDRMKDRVTFVPWAPQLQVLQHSAVGGFLTHYGWNSVLESISAGVPMVGWPFFGDHMLNCKFAVDAWRIGLRMQADDTGCVQRTEVQTKVKELMDGEGGRELRKRARDLKDAALRGLTRGGASDHMELIVKAAKRG